MKLACATYSASRNRENDNMATEGLEKSLREVVEANKASRAYREWEALTTLALESAIDGARRTSCVAGVWQEEAKRALMDAFVPRTTMTETIAHEIQDLSPPGDILAEALEERGMKNAELARRAGLSEKHVSQLLNARVPLSMEVAFKLEQVLGIPATLWLNLESNYRAEQKGDAK